MLKQLSEEEFAKRAAGGARTPVFREFLADRETPVSVLTRAAADGADPEEILRALCAEVKKPGIGVRPR